MYLSVVKNKLNPEQIKICKIPHAYSKDPYLYIQIQMTVPSMFGFQIQRILNTITTLNIQTLPLLYTIQSDQSLCTQWIAKDPSFLHA